MLAAVLLTSGCGSSHKSATHRASTRSSTPGASPTDCNTLGINPTRMREGTCTHGGVTYVIVDENHALRLRTLTARLAGLRKASSLIGGQPASAQGTFVIALLTITNRLELPQMFDKSGTQQTEINLGGTPFPEDVTVEKSSGPNSCLSSKGSIGPGKSETCQVVFDVPKRAAAQLGKHGSGDLYMVDFGSDLGGSITPQAVGQIRLYH